MLSDEEKTAIKELTEIKELFEEDLKENYEVTAILDQIDLESLVIALNLIEKQSKEIEELTTNQLDLKDKCIKIAKKLEEDNKPFVSEYILAQIGACPVWDCGEPYSNYISKDKIKAKTIEIKNRPVKDEFITASQGKLNTIIDMESLLEKE